MRSEGIRRWEEQLQRTSDRAFRTLITAADLAWLAGGYIANSWLIFSCFREEEPGLWSSQEAETKSERSGKQGPLHPQPRRLGSPGFVSGGGGVSFLCLGHQRMTDSHIPIRIICRGTGHTILTTILLGT